MSVGLALGDFCGVVAVAREEGAEEVVANADGVRYTHSYVGFGDEGAVSIGLAAVHESIKNAKGTVRRFVSLLSSKYDDEAVQASIAGQTCKTVNADGMVAFEVQNHDGAVSPSELCTMLLQRLWQTALTASPDATDAVLAVPIGCSAEHTAALVDCAKHAGFAVKQCIPEPVAAALGLGIGQGPAKDETVLVFDMGASRTTVTVVQSRGGALAVVGSASDSNVGGAACDAALMKLFIKEFKKAHKMDISDQPKAIAKLAAAAADAKHTLSTASTATLFVESLFEGVDFSLKLTRSKVESTVSSVYRKCGGLIMSVLESCGLGTDDITQVILAGGASIPPKVGKVVSMMFDGRDVVNATVAGNEVFALGAAHQAALLRDVASLDDAPETARQCAAADICLKDAAGGMAVLVSAGTPLPASRSARLRTSEENQASIAVELFQVGEAAAGGDAPAPAALATAALKELPAGPAGSVAVTLTVTVAVDGTTEVELAEAKSGTSVKGTIPSKA